MQHPVRERLAEFVRVLGERTGLQVVDIQQALQLHLTRGSGVLDALVQMTGPGGQPLWLAVEEFNTAYPRDVRAAVEMLGFYRAAINRTPVTLCVIASTLSPGARSTLRDAGVNYYDDSGTLFFQHEQTLIDIERTSTLKPRRAVNLFTGARERVVHAMLHHWHSSNGDGWLSGEQLAAMSETSTYTVSTLMREMERHEWVEAIGKGPGLRRRLHRPAELLDAWASEWTSRDEPRSRWYAYTGRTSITDKVLRDLRDIHSDTWAITGAAAANAVLPHLTRVDQVAVIVPPGESETWAQMMDLESAEKGANIVFIERTGASLLFLDEHPERPGSRFASCFVQYLDLLDGYGRNQELASEYRSQILKVDV